MRFPAPLLTLAALLTTPLAAQIGDRLDKPGEVQKSLVPADQVPPAPALSPQEALATFKLAPGIRLELAAAEPLVEEPVAIAFGPDGRMWVVEMRGYMPDLDGNGEDAPIGRIVVLRDRDGDGRYDDRTIFLDQLVLPRALLLVGDGALVGAPPELAHWRDTDGDGRADKKVLLASDYGVAVDPKRPFLANPERAPNSLLWARDNWIYSAAYTKKFRFVNGEWQTGATSFRGQWGLSEDDYGRLYHNSNSDHLRVDLVHSDYLQRNPNFARLAGTNVNAASDQLVWPARVTPGINRGYRPDMLRDGRLKEFTAACAPFVYRGDLLPELHGSVFVAEPAAHFVRRAVMHAENGTLRGRNPYERSEFIASTDERFRPVNFATGPDGALYIVDLYRGVLQHRISLTSYLRQQSIERKLVDPQHLGRIYRVVPASRPAPRATQLAELTNAQWVERLAHASAWWRETAQRILVERRDPATIPAIAELARTATNPLGRVHALWTLEGIGGLDRAATLRALGDPSPVVRAGAIRLSERFLAQEGRAEIVARWRALAEDPAAEVQLQAVLSLGEVRDLETAVATANVVRRQARHALLRDAFFSGLANREFAVLERLAAQPDWPADDAEANKILGGLARGIFASRDLAAIERLLALTAAEPAGSRRAAALVEGMSAAAALTKRPLVFEQQPAGLARLSQAGTSRAAAARIAGVMTWPGKAGAGAAAAAALTPEQQARFDAGKPLFHAICASCHQATGRGLDGLAPPLLDSEWVLGSADRMIRIVLHGVRGNIQVLGRTHTGDMPAFGALDDEQIAAIITYVRREWGHTASPVAPGDVARIRAASQGRTDAWSAEELNLAGK